MLLCWPEVYDKHGTDVVGPQQARFLGTLDFSGRFARKKPHFEAIHIEEQSGCFSVQFPSVFVFRWLHPRELTQLHSQVVSPSPKWTSRKPELRPHDIVLHARTEVRGPLGIGIV